MVQETYSLSSQAEYNDDWNRQFRAGDFSEMPDDIRIQGQKVIDLFLSLNLRNPNILEVGCGTGWLTQKLDPHGHVVAVDLGPEAIAIAKTRNLNATFLTGDFLQLDIPEGHFDVCVTVGTVSCFEDQDALFTKIGRVLKPGGHLIIATNNRFVFERLRDQPIPKIGRIMNWTTPAELRALLTRASFAVPYQSTLSPTEGVGILRLLAMFDGPLSTRLKERLGFGAYILAMARKNN